MSWTYSGNPAASDLDRLRFLTGDINPDEPVLQDEEFTFLIAEYGANENLLRYNAFRQIATIFARDIRRSLGPQSEDPTERLKFFKEQQAYYRSKLGRAGLSLPIYAHPKVFSIGMQDNPPWPPVEGD